MKIRLVLTAMALVTATVSTSAFSYQSQPKTLEEGSRQTFDSWDGNSDGELNIQEFSDFAQYELGRTLLWAGHTFDGMDADASGALSFAEFTGGVCCI